MPSPPPRSTRSRNGKKVRNGRCNKLPFWQTRILCAQPPVVPYPHFETRARRGCCMPSRRKSCASGKNLGHPASCRTIERRLYSAQNRKTQIPKTASSKVMSFNFFFYLPPCMHAVFVFDSALHMAPASRTHAFFFTTQRGRRCVAQGPIILMLVRIGREE